MDIKIYGPDDDESKITGLTVVVDVFRAFSMAYYINNNEPLKYIIVDDIDLAFELKEKYKSLGILIGEHNGVKIEGFSYGNSPSEIYNKSFKNKIIIHTTSAGTKGLLKQPVNNEVLVGGFVNCQALIEYVAYKQIDKINIYCTAPKNTLYGEEDYLFAEYFSNKLLHKETDLESIIMKLRSGSGKGFKENGFASYSDFLYCLDYSRFNVVLQRKKTEDDGRIIELEEVRKH